MSNIRILDCTLRDGGYCNNWNFGEKNICRIIDALLKADIDIVECGFVTEKVKLDSGITKFPSLESAARIIPNDRGNKLFVCMINYGDYPIESIQPYNGGIDGIRVAFHKSDMMEAIDYCKKIAESGYKVFIQPMASLNYTDREFMDLIGLSNEIKPYAFYIVDSFGGMKEHDLLRLYYLVEHELNDEIRIGFHSHNNMQLAYSNAKSLINMKTQRQLIIDASIYGMGRGAGNLNTELLIEYTNNTEGTNYNLQPLLVVIDQILNKFYQENNWGYSIPNYLSAKHNTHPNYANYLVDKQTLLIEDMDQIFAMMPDDKKAKYDKKYIEDLYYRYMENGKWYEENLNEFKLGLSQKKVVIIAPGKSVESEKDKIIEYVQSKEIVTIAINFEYPYLETDYIFVSNLRRYKELNKKLQKKCIFTSNIPAETGYLKIRYSSLLNNIEEVRDNAGMMLLQLLVNLGVQEIAIAGMDGYSHDADDNYAINSMSFTAQYVILDEKNKGMETLLKRFAKQINIQFITKSKYLSL